MGNDEKLKEMIKHLENLETQFKLAIEAAYKDGFKDGRDSLLIPHDVDYCWKESDAKSTLDWCE